MPDEYYERYRHLTHQELYAKLTAGVPGQVDGLATVWKSIQDTATGLASALRRDLDRLRRGWDSPAGREFQRRVELVAGYAQSLAGDFESMRGGLGTMSLALTEAQKKAESPDKTDDLDSTVSAAAKGAAIGAILGPGGSVIGGIVGGALGHDKDEEEREKARERMVALVSWLAAEYDVTAHGTWPGVVSQPPIGLPTGDPGPRTEPTAAGPVTRPPRPPTTNLPGDSGAKHRLEALPHPVTKFGDGGGPPGSGLSGDAGTTSPGDGSPVTAANSDAVGTGLLGAGTDPLTAGPGAGGTGLTGTPGVPSAGAAGTPAPGPTSLTGITAGHVLGAPRGEHDDRSSSTGSQRSATAATGRVDGRSAVGGDSSTGEGGTDEHLTWLTEDDMVWDDDSAPPAVLGEAGPASPRTDQSR